VEIRERIIKYLENSGISKYKFYQKTGFSNGFLDKSGAIGSDKCEIICYEYPDINPEWLLMEKGEMLRSGQSETVASGDSLGAVGEEINVYKEINRELRKEIGELNRRIGELNYEARVLRGEVEKLSEKLKGVDAVPPSDAE
jgi:hypothetical protein